MNRLAGLRERLRTSLWFIPALFGLSAFVAGLLVVEVDRALQFEGSAFFLYGGTPEGARSVLSTIAQSMLTFTGLVFTVTMLVLQLASSQLSPRVLRTFLADRANQVVLGLFVATFIFTLVVLRNVRAEEAGSSFVPGLAVWVALVLLGASVAAFIYYINHMAHAIRASTVISNIGRETGHTIDRTHPHDHDGVSWNEDAAATIVEGGEPTVVTADDAGSVASVDEGELLKIARQTGARIVVVPRIGDFVPHTDPLIEVRGAAVDDDLAERLRRTVSLGRERSMQQDPAFGFRQLLDVAIRALSPGTNDPTTAVQAIDALHDLLIQLAERPLGPRIRFDDDGAPRVLVDGATWADYVQLATEELRLYGAGHVQVVRRLKRMLDGVAAASPVDRRQAVYAELDRLRDVAGEADPPT